MVAPARRCNTTPSFDTASSTGSNTAAGKELEKFGGQNVWGNIQQSHPTLNTENGIVYMIKNKKKSYAAYYYETNLKYTSYTLTLLGLEVRC